MSFIGIITARAGSKGIPSKNLHPLAKKPLIHYTVLAALNSKLLTDVFLSTDSNQIAESCALIKNIDFGYRRPPELASDTASIIDTVIHGLDFLEQKMGKTYDHVVLLQPTSPLRTADDIDSSISTYISSKKHSLVSVNEMNENPHECIKLLDDNKWDYLASRNPNLQRRQDYTTKYFYINGAVYIKNVKKLREERTFVDEHSSGIYVMPQSRSIDIDYGYQIPIAESLLSNLNTTG